MVWLITLTVFLLIKLLTALGQLIKIPVNPQVVNVFALVVLELIFLTVFPVNVNEPKVLNTEIPAVCVVVGVAVHNQTLSTVLFVNV